MDRESLSGLEGGIVTMAPNLVFWDHGIGIWVGPVSTGTLTCPPGIQNLELQAPWDREGAERLPALSPEVHFCVVWLICLHLTGWQWRW